MTTSISYKEAGVNIDEGNLLVEKIKPLVKQTKRPEVMGGLGGYGGLFALDLKKYPEPVLVSTTDGVGTKLKLAFETNKFDTIGIDLVAMCVNDLVCVGAEPLFFLDYFATGALSADTGATVIKGIADALKSFNCTLIGGETAEMPGFYKKGEFDLAGFAVGVANRGELIDGKKVVAGDAIIGIESSGVHSNGFSLVRKILEANNIDLTKDKLEFDKPIGLVLLEPTRLYVNAVLALLKEVTVKSLAHITGGGLLENVPRVIPENKTAVFSKKQIPTPRLFKLLQELGKVEEREMWRVFNMGVGMTVVVSAAEKDKALATLKKLGFAACEIGKIEEKGPNGEGVILVD